jgi:predicted porin
MKKHLIAAAVAAAVAVPAMAQNVTISGYIEANYGRIDTGAVSTAGMNGSVNVFGGSELKIAGSEDLGGGLKAGFSLLQEFDENRGLNDNATGQTRTGSTDTFDQPWKDVQLFVSGGFGEVKVGKFISTHRDLGGVYRFNGDFGRVDTNFNTIGNRPSNQIQFTTPTISGVTFTVAHAKGDSNGVIDAGSQSGWSLRYAEGPLRVQYSSSSIKSAANVKDKESGIGGSYTMGNIRVGAAYMKDDTEVAANEAEAVSLQLDVDMGGGINLFGSYNSYEHTTSARDGQAYALGASKALSKRTKVFLVHNNDKNDSAATWRFRNGNAITAGNDPSRTALGLSHSF